MRTTVLAILAVTSLGMAQLPRTLAPTAAVPAHPTTSHPLPAIAAAAAPHSAGVAPVALPAGWGLAPQPVSTVTHPGGYGVGIGVGRSTPPVVNQGGYGPGRYGNGRVQFVYVPAYIGYVSAPQDVQQSASYYAPVVAGDAVLSQQTPQAQDTYVPYTASSSFNANTPDTPDTPIYVEPYTPLTAPFSKPEATTVIPVAGDKDKAADASAPYTLLIFKDHSIYAVTKYNVEDGRLAYTTTYGSSNTVSFDQLDLEATFKINKDREVKFELREK